MTINANPLFDRTVVFPALDKITPDHLKEAFTLAFDDYRKQFDAIRDNPAAPSFDNVVVPLEKMSHETTRLFRILGHFNAGKSSDAITALGQWAEEIQDGLSKTLFQDQVLAARFKTVYDARDTVPLDEEDRRLLKDFYEGFEENGSFLTEAGQQAIKAIDLELIRLTTVFIDNMRKGSKQQALLFSSAQIGGLPDNDREAMARNAERVIESLKPGAGDDLKDFLKDIPQPLIDRVIRAEAAGALNDCFIFFPERLAVDSLLCVAHDRDFRRQIAASINAVGIQPPYDNRPVIGDIQRLRHDRTMLLNQARPADRQYRHYADFAQSKTMYGSYDRVNALLDEAQAPLLKQFERNMATLQAYATQAGGPEMLEPWDVPYYLTRYKKDVFGFDMREFIEYFPLENVQKGFFIHAEKLMGLEFHPAPQGLYPALDDHVKTFEVFNKSSGTLAGIFVFDPFKRPGLKSGGAWMDVLQASPNDKSVPAIVSFNMNLQAGERVLLDPDSVYTFFHEGGHDINGLKGQAAKYFSHRDTFHEIDAVEIPSMIFERWPFEREVLDTYAINGKGENLPDDLLDRMKKSNDFMAEIQTLRVIQNARWDFAFHTMDPAQYTDHLSLQKGALIDSPYAEHVRPYHLNRFDHLFSSGTGGYAASYCGYFVADVHSEHGFQSFKRHGLYDPVTARRLEGFYAGGAGRDQAKAYEAFAGSPASAAALLESLGIKAANSTTPGKDPDQSTASPGLN